MPENMIYNVVYRFKDDNEMFSMETRCYETAVKFRDRAIEVGNVNYIQIFAYSEEFAEEASK